MENELLMSSLLPTWHSLLPAPDLSCPPGAEQSLGCLFAPYWDKSTESSGCRMLDSAISSLDDSAVSPPNTSNDSFLMRELIGKLGGSCEFPPQTYNSGHLYKESSPTWGHPTSAANPVFPELSPAARFSSLGTRSFNGRTGQYLELAATGKTMSRISSSPSLRPTGSPWGAPQGNTNPHPAPQDRAELSNSQEESSVSNPGKIPGPELAAKTLSEANWRKRRAANRGKEAEIENGSGTKRDKRSDGCNENANGSVKIEDEEKGGSGDNADVKDEKLLVKNEKKPPEPSKDYIHVRARRGQATDSHSLAERVRREKISERMKILQDLVPGCSKVTGKALMLDEIINYVQSLQRQVEFLSMKLATVNAGMDGSMNTTMMKDAFKPESNDPLQMLPSSAALYIQKIPAASISDGAIPQYSVDPFLPYQAFHGGDLHSIIQMSCGQD